MTRPEWVTRALTAAVDTTQTAPRDPASLADTLYARWHAGADDGALREGPPDLAELLRRAHAGSDHWDPGWVVAATHPGAALTVVRDGVARHATAPDYVNTVRPGVPPAPGEAVALVERTDWLDPSGWWASTSARHGFPDGAAARLYVNASAIDAADVIAAVTRALEAAAVPWALKAPPSASGYRRRDTMIVTFAREDWPRLVPLVGELDGLLEPATPPLAKPLAPGLAVADDPGGGRSFGELRCAEVADVLLAGALDAADPVEALAAGLHARGVDPARPHLLEPRPDDPYRL